MKGDYYECRSMSLLRRLRPVDLNKYSREEESNYEKSYLEMGFG
jgi:hypothetical protein